MTTLTAKARPILMSGAMVQAIKLGRKTQTRRVMKPQPTALNDTLIKWKGEELPIAWCNRKNSYISSRCPYGQAGDELWVRESFSLVEPPLEVATCRAVNGVWYKADYSDLELALIKENKAAVPGGFKWKPSIHIRKEDSRLRLRLQNVWLERAQAISEEDAVKEGVAIKIQKRTAVGPSFGRNSFINYLNPTGDALSALNSFKSLWQSINGKVSGAANPWVWVLEFEVV